MTRFNWCQSYKILHKEEGGRADGEITWVNAEIERQTGWSLQLPHSFKMHQALLRFPTTQSPQCADPVLWQTRLVWIRSSSLFITHCALQRITAKWEQHESVVTYTPPWVSVVYLVRSVQPVYAPVMIWRIKPMCDTYFFFPLWVCGIVGGGGHRWHVTVWPRRSGSGQ